MYEHYITACKNGLIDIDTEINEHEFWNTDENTDVNTNPRATTVTATFAVTTDSEATMTIDGNGFVYTAFGGTGTTRTELDTYAEQLVEIWRRITGDHTTTCRYKLRDNDNRDQTAEKHIINA